MEDNQFDSLYRANLVEELITLIENVAESVSIGQCNPDSMSLLLASLKSHGPQLEEYSKSTLDQGRHKKLKKNILHVKTLPIWQNEPENFRSFTIFFSISETSTHHTNLTAYVKFRNASQDERLSIITRMNLLELIELRARSWQVADGSSTYYKHKVPNLMHTEKRNIEMKSIFFHLGKTSPMNCWRQLAHWSPTYGICLQNNIFIFNFCLLSSRKPVMHQQDCKTCHS